MEAKVYDRNVDDEIIVSQTSRLLRYRVSSFTLTDHHASGMISCMASGSLAPEMPRGYAALTNALHSRWGAQIRC